MTKQDELKNRFSLCVEECMTSMYRLALRLTRNNADADDLVAETVEKAWKAFASLENHKQFRAWSLRIMHNSFISQYRKKKVRPQETPIEQIQRDYDGDGDVTTLMFDQPDDFVMWWGNPERQFVNNLLGEDIVKAIDELPEVFREVIILVNIEGLTYDEAAAILGVPGGTVRSRMKRGRTLLQKNLWQHGKDAGLIDETELEGNTP